MTQMCLKLRKFEEPRIGLIHGAINSFVVFEMSAEMNNKYDIGNFAKLLEEFTPESEMAKLNRFMFGNGETDP